MLSIWWLHFPCTFNVLLRIFTCVVPSCCVLKSKTLSPYLISIEKCKTADYLISWVKSQSKKCIQLLRKTVINYSNMKIFSSILLDYSLFYGLILFCSFVFLFAVFEIYFDRKKNLWNLPGPFPLPLFGSISYIFKLF